MRSFDAAVVGSGSFGAWTAWHLRRAGLSVALIDAYGAGNVRSSSGGESRIIRLGYGEDALYTRLAQRSLQAWQALAARVEPPLFARTGVLWMGKAGDSYMTATLSTIGREGVHHESLDGVELARRYPQVDLSGIEWGILEPESGALFARRGVQAVSAEAGREGVERIEASVRPGAGHGALSAIALSSGEHLSAGVFVFACGAWLGRLFPDVIGSRLFPTRQEVFYLGPPSGDASFRPPAMPIWLDLTEEVYGFPDLEGRGFKLASDRHGPPFDPDVGERAATAEGVAAIREFAGRRFPGLRGAPLLPSEVCQYENTSNGDFLIDRHPDFENVWLVGGGSGHGFKHGPALGEDVARLVTRGGEIEPRFRLETKAPVQRRTVH